MSKAIPHENITEDLRLSHEIAEEVAHATKPEIDHLYDIEQAKSELLEFNHSTVLAQTEIESRYLSGGRHNKDHNELEEDRKLAEDELHSEAVSFLQRNDRVQNFLIEFGASLGFSPLVKERVEMLKDPEAAADKLVASGFVDSKSKAETFVIGEVATLASELINLASMSEGTLQRRSEQKLNEAKLKGEWKSSLTALSIEQDSTTLHELAEIAKEELELDDLPSEDELAKLSARDIWLVADRLSTKKDNLEQAALSWAARKDVKQLSDVSEKEKLETRQSILLRMDEELGNTFGTDSDEYNGFLKLQQSDVTTVKDLKAFYDDAIISNRSAAIGEFTTFNRNFARLLSTSHR